jgi:glycosyltransferase involved in cell wall biosynthesis
MLAHAYYEEDSRVRRQAESLVSAGRPVDVFALRRVGDAPSDVIAGVQLSRLPVSRHQGAGLATYLREYAEFFGRAAIALARAHRRRRYALVQVHTLPDFLVFAALPLRMARVPVLLDLHEAMPAFFKSRFPRSWGALAVRALEIQETLATSFADAVVTVNDALADRLVRRGVRPEKLTVIVNGPARDLFAPELHAPRSFMADGRLRLVYAGALTPIYELDVVLRAVATLWQTRPALRPELDIYGRGDSEPGLRKLAAQLRIEDHVRFNGRIPLEAVPGAIAMADIGLAPTRRDPFTDFSLSSKLLEYAAMDKPVVASRLATLQRYFPSGTVITYEPGNPDDLARVLGAAADDPGLRRRTLQATRERLSALDWDAQSAKYVALVERLAGGRLSSGDSAPIAAEAPSRNGADPGVAQAADATAGPGSDASVEHATAGRSSQRSEVA